MRSGLREALAEAPSERLKLDGVKEYKASWKKDGALEARKCFIWILTLYNLYKQSLS